MAEDTLSFEIDLEANRLDIHMDGRGLERLIGNLQRLRGDASRAAAMDHDHLMSASWGGGELADEPIGGSTRLVNHVKLILWKDAPS